MYIFTRPFKDSVDTCGTEWEYLESSIVLKSTKYYIHIKNAQYLQLKLHN